MGVNEEQTDAGDRLSDSVGKFMQSSRSRGVALVLASLGASVLSVLPLSQAQAAARPDLVVAKVSASADQVIVGHKVKVTDTTKNAGTAKAASATTAYYLSKDKVRSAKDVRLGGRDQQRLGGGAKDAGSASVLVPTKTKPRRSGSPTRATTAVRRAAGSPSAPPPPPASSPRPRPR